MHVGIRYRVRDDHAVVAHLNDGAGDVHDTGTADRGKTIEEHTLVREDRQFVATDHVEAEEVLVEERRRPGARHHCAGVHHLHVTHRPGELAVHLGVHEFTHSARRLVVHHRVPDGPGELQEVEIHSAVPAECVEVRGAAVVLVDEHVLGVEYHDGGIPTRPVGDRGLHVNRHLQAAAEVGQLSVLGSDELHESEVAQATLELPRRIPGEQDRGVPADVVDEPRLVEMIGVDVRDVQIVGVLDALHQPGLEQVVAGEDEPRAEEGREEPWVADDGPGFGLDEDPGVADGGSSHDPLRLRPSGCPHRYARWLSGGTATVGSPRLRGSVPVMPEFISVSASSYDPASLASKLSEKSAEGWQVVAIVPTGGDITAFLSRGVQATTATATAAAPAQFAPTPTVITTSAPSSVAEPAGWGTAPAQAVPQAASTVPTITTSATPVSVSGTPAGWYHDPSGRFELRYWDATQWTEHVSRAGTQFTDPPVA